MLPSSRTISPHSQVEDLMTETLASIRNLLGMEVAFISEFSEGRRVFRFIDSQQGFRPIEVDGSDPLSESYCQRVVDGRLPELLQDATKNPEAMTLAATMAVPIGAHLSVPIRFSSGRLFGTFCCFSRTPDMTLGARDLKTMKLFASFVGNVLEEREAEEDKKRAIRRGVQKVLDERLFSTLFQPIVDISSMRTIGFEALTRFSSAPNRSPNEWIADATSVGLQETLELALLKSALQQLKDLPPDVYLSLNVAPNTLLKGSIPELFSGYPLQRLVLEITEQDSISDYEKIEAELAPLRARGMRLAVDDAGAGYASFRHILKLKPDIIKLDYSLIKGIDTDLASKTLATAIVSFGKSTGSEILAEGVETEAELDTLRGLGIERVQGFLLGRPELIGRGEV